MNEFVKAISRFVTRDIPYIVGGTSVILCFLYLLDAHITKDIPLPFILFYAGIAYVLGYAIKDGLSLLRIICTGIRVTPNRLLIFLFNRWTGGPWKTPNDFDAEHMYLQLYTEPKNEALVPIERIISLMSLAHTMGTTWLICTILLGLKCFIDPNPFNLSLCFFSLILSVILILLGWLQLMQSVHWLHQIYKINLSKPAAANADQADEADA